MSIIQSIYLAHHSDNLVHIHLKPEKDSPVCGTVVGAPDRLPIDDDNVCDVCGQFGLAWVSAQEEDEPS